MSSTDTVPPLVLGTMTFGDTSDRNEATRIFDHALSCGITWIDTANVYAGGRSEEILSELLHPHEHLVVATKVGMPSRDVGEHALLSRQGIRRALEGSLRRLRRDHVDLLYLHRPDRDTPLRETLTAVAELVAEEKVSAFGVSNYAAWQVAELIRAADETGAPRPVVGQQLYNVIARRLDEEYAEYTATTGLPTMIYNPLAGGLLTGRYGFEQPAASGRFGTAQLAGTYRDRYWDARLFRHVNQLKQIAAAAGLPLLEMALRWTISRPVTDSVLLGASHAEHINVNIQAMRKGRLADDVLKQIDAVGAELRGPMPAYNR